MKTIFSVSITALLLVFTLCCAQAMAQTPREVAESSAKRILAILNDPAFKNPATKAQMRQRIEDEALNLFDFEEFSTRTVGPSWRDFTPDQKKRFIAAFTSLLRNTYIDKLDSYNGEQMLYMGEVSDDSGIRVEVRMEFKAKSQSYPVAFRMLLKNERWVVYDVLIEGISMIKNYRDQFRDIMAKGSPEELIKRVEDKAGEIARKPA